MPHLKWASSEWLLRDLGSTNGTWVNGELIAKGRDCVVGEGTQIAFGSQRLAWHLADAHPPEPMVVPVGGGDPVLHSRRGDRYPFYTKGKCQHFSRFGWCLDARSGRPSDADSARQRLRRARGRLALLLPHTMASTVPLQSVRLLEGSGLQFEVSSDEESVTLTIDTGRELVHLGESNTFYLLLTLARLRLQEQDQRPPAEVGWVHREQLIRMLRCDPQLLNVWVCRIRSKLVKRGLLGLRLDHSNVATALGRLRIGPATCLIRRLA